MTELQTIINNLKESITAAGTILKILEAEKETPKPEPHMWEHGDVFETGVFGTIMMYHKFTASRKPEAICISQPCGGPSLDLEITMSTAKFLFNIKETL
jgi:hypothetical protein